MKRHTWAMHSRAHSYCRRCGLLREKRYTRTVWREPETIYYKNDNGQVKMSKWVFACDQEWPKDWYPERRLDYHKPSDQMELLK